MADKIETSHSIRTWAQTAFPDSFAKFDEFIRTDRTVKLRINGHIIDGFQVDKPDVLKAINVGLLVGQCDGTVYAWVGRDGSARLGHTGKCQLRVHSDTANPRVHFGRPYCWVGPAEDETGAAHFEALIRYYLCIRGIRSTGIRFGIGTFKEHFPGAWCDVAEQVIRKVRKKGTADRCVRLIPIAPMLPQVDKPEYRDERTTPTATPNEYLQAIDQAFATFRNGLNTQINAAQAIDNREKADLATQVHNLELRVTDAEAERDKLKDNLVEAKKEAEKWKAQYEGLKKAMQKTMERRF